MKTLEAIAKRKSTRNYTPEKISEEALETILKAGFAAPVAMARYDMLHITVVESQQMLDRANAAAAEMMRKAGVQKNMDFGAKTLVLVSTMPLPRAGMELASAGIVVENMVLAATDLGIDSVVLGAVPAAVAQDDVLTKDLGIPEGFTPFLGIFLGYGAEETPVKQHTIAVNRV